MNIAALSTAITQSEVQSQVATAVARKALDVQQRQGQAAIELLQAAAECCASPEGVGENVDVKG